MNEHEYEREDQDRVGEMETPEPMEHERNPRDLDPELNEDPEAPGMEQTQQL